MRAACYLACLALVMLALGALVLAPRHVPPWLALVGGLAALLAGRLDPARALSPVHARRDAAPAPMHSPLPVNRRRPR